MPPSGAQNQYPIPQSIEAFRVPEIVKLNEAVNAAYNNLHPETSPTYDQAPQFGEYAVGAAVKAAIKPETYKKNPNVVDASVIGNNLAFARKEATQDQFGLDA
ncbi:hypothetical protein KC945_00700 [Candidatus Saccharibacteria bacterium]|nr:hypothetical protein [Candidatus Saccharibacteria bacterium]